MTLIKNKSGQIKWFCPKHKESQIRWLNPSCKLALCPICLESMIQANESPKKNPKKVQDQKLI